MSAATSIGFAFLGLHMQVVVGEILQATHSTDIMIPELHVAGEVNWSACS